MAGRLERLSKLERCPDHVQTVATASSAAATLKLIIPRAMIERYTPNANKMFAKRSGSIATRRMLVQEHFKEAATFWKHVYGATDVYGRIHQQRRAVVLSMVDSLRLKPGSPVLDIGCGAGSTSVALASRGLNVAAVDPVPEMVELTKQAAFEARAGSNLTASLGDVHDLAFSDSSFRLVLAIGVLPWLSTYADPLLEIARVLQPGGFLVVSVDNSWAIHRLLDPGTNFLLSPLKRTVGRMLRYLRLRRRKAGCPTSMASPRAFGHLLFRLEFEVERSVTFGYGPFSFLGRNLVPDSLGLKIHSKLQQLCERRIPIVRSMGAQHLVLARKR